MAAEGPAHAYYRACVGRWHCPLQITVTDAARLAASGMGLLDRLSLRLFSRWPRWLGRVTMETSVAFDASGDVVHTTHVRWLGLPLQRSVEVFTLAPDGISLTVRGGMTGTARALPGGTSVEYELRWRGAPIRQRTERAQDQVTIRMEGPGFAGVQRLARRPG
jgi:hypothetical protein